MPTEDPLFSIITPSYNQGRFIRDAIESVQSQGAGSVEHIIVDGASTDETLAILEQTPDSVRWVSEPDQGQTSAINRGLGMARGEILAWLNCDDVYLPGAFETVARVFAEQPDVDLVYGDCESIDEAGQARYTIYGRAFDRDVLTKRINFIEQPTAFFRRRALEDVGPLDESLHFTMDFDLWLRMTDNHRAVYVPSTLAACRKHGEAKTTGASAPTWANVLEVARLARRHGAPLLNRHTTKLFSLWLVTRMRLRGVLQRLATGAGYDPGRAGRY